MKLITSESMLDRGGISGCMSGRDMHESGHPVREDMVKHAYSWIEKNCFPCSEPDGYSVDSQTLTGCIDFGITGGPKGTGFRVYAGEALVAAMRLGYEVNEVNGRGQIRFGYHPRVEDDATGANADSEGGKKSVVYFILEHERGRIKIGYTSGDTSERCAILQTGCPSRLSVICAVPGGRQLEKCLHVRFKCCRKGGEWFDPDTELMKLISELVENR